MPSLLVIDDDASVLQVFRRVFQDTDTIVHTAQSGEEGLEIVKRHDPDTVILDIVLPDISGLEMFEKVHRIDPKVPVIFITAGGASDTAIEAMKLGAFDYLLKPLDFPKVRELVARAFEIRRFMHVPVTLSGESHSNGNGDALIGRCPAMQEVYKAIGRVAPQNVTVLDPRRERHREGADRPGHLSAQPAGVGPVSRRQLRGDPGGLAGKRAVRPRKRLVHWGRRQADRQVRAMLGRHAVPR